MSICEGILYDSPNIGEMLRRIDSESPDLASPNAIATPRSNDDEVAALKREIAALRSELQRVRQQQFDSMPTERQSNLGQFARDFYRAASGEAVDAELAQYSEDFFKRNTPTSLY